jgi:pyruvate formate lyase activating enzyme
MGIVFDIRKYSIHDGPGIRTTVFLKGCPLHCQWCHNPEGQSPEVEIILRSGRCIRCGACVEACPHGAARLGEASPEVQRERCERCGECTLVCYAEARQVVGREMTVAQVMAEVERDIPFYDESDGGVTLSGGEPLAQRDFALGLLEACKEREIHTALDTCGFASWDTFERVRGDVDLFLYDLKVVDDARHREFTGVSNTLILNNLQKLSERDHLILLRMPVIPGVNDDEENIRQTGEFVAALPRAHSLELLPYHHAATSKYAGLGQEYPLPDTRTPSEERLGWIAGILRAYGVQVKYSPGNE